MLCKHFNTTHADVCFIFPLMWQELRTLLSKKLSLVVFLLIQMQKGVHMHRTFLLSFISFLLKHCENPWILVATHW